jgi:hypothetical protein
MMFVPGELGSTECPAFLRIRLMEEMEGMVEASQTCQQSFSNQCRQS